MIRNGVKVQNWTCEFERNLFTEHISQWIFSDLFLYFQTHVIRPLLPRMQAVVEATKQSEGRITSAICTLNSHLRYRVLSVFVDSSSQRAIQLTRSFWVQETIPKFVQEVRNHSEICSRSNFGFSYRMLFIWVSRRPFEYQMAILSWILEWKLDIKTFTDFWFVSHKSPYMELVGMSVRPFVNISFFIIWIIKKWSAQSFSSWFTIFGKGIQMNSFRAAILQFL